MATENGTINEQSQKETGFQIHQRETWRQIYIPFALGLLALLALVLIVALPSDPIWRIRAEGIADWMVTILCLLPIVACIFPLFLIVMLGIWGMNRVHASTERPLRKLEKMAADLAAQVNKVNDYIIEKTTQVSTTIEPAMSKLSAFDTPDSQEVEEISDDRAERESSTG